MRILAVSVAPLFPHFVMGGSQRVLMDVVEGLGGAGHEVRLLCSRAPGNESGFSPSTGVTVEPSLRLKGFFPSPYETSPDNLLSTWRALQSAAIWADRIYLHADAIYMRSALGDKPIIRSLHDFIYEEALLSAFTLPADRTIVPSEYLRRCVEASAGRVNGVGELIAIPNGTAIPGAAPSPVAPEGVSPRQPGDLMLLHPHRLQPRKGLRESMLITAELQRRMPDRRVRLLVPAFPASETLDETTDSIEEIMQMARETGTGDALEPHRWLSPDEMPGYFAFGDVTLCPGSFVESFGLVPVESVVSGTPVVCARVGALRDMEGLTGISHVDHGDIEAAADSVMAIVAHAPDTAAGREDIATRFSHRKMVESYVGAITGRLPRPGRSRPTSDDVSGSLALAPWCHVSGSRIYHDYLARFEQFPALTRAIADSAGAVERGESGPTLSAEIDRAMEDGFLVFA